MKPTKRQLIDRFLFLYGGVVAFSLTGTAFKDLNSPSSLITLALFLPVSLYFFIKIVFFAGQLSQRFLNLNQKRHPYFGPFSLSAFIGQSDHLFVINLFLFSLAISIVLFRISLQIIQ